MNPRNCRCSYNPIDPVRLARPTLDMWERGPDAAHWPPTQTTAMRDAYLLQVTTREMTAALQRAFVQIGEAVRKTALALTEFGKTLQAPHQVPPTNVQARALWLVQHRNTGPDQGPVWQQRSGATQCDAVRPRRASDGYRYGHH